MHISDVIAKLKAGEGFAATAIVETLKEGASFAEKLVPIAEVIGGPSLFTAISTLSIIRDAAENLIEAGNNAGVVFSTDNIDDINRIIDKLAVENDKLAKLIDDS